YSVLDGLGMPCTSETRPLKFAGPTFRHRKAATTVLSNACADRVVARAAAIATPETTVINRDRCISNPAEWETKRPAHDITVTRAFARVLASTERGAVRWARGVDAARHAVDC